MERVFWQRPMNRYVITSNRGSGFGRYDVLMEPKIFMIKELLWNLRYRIWRRRKKEQFRLV